MQQPIQSESFRHVYGKDQQSIKLQGPAELYPKLPFPSVPADDADTNMSGPSPQHHDTAAENAGGPATVTSGAAAGQFSNEIPPDDRIDLAAAAAAAVTTHPSSYHHDDNAAGDAETLSYPPLDPSQPLLPPANFSPFFALVEDATTAEHHHPSVHYVFSDDDPELHTAVFMRALGDNAPASPTATKHHDGAAEEEGGDLLPPPAPGVRERYVVVDLTPDGQGVAGATSLSRDWQVVGTAVAPAPSFAEDGADDAGGGGALMLRVEGAEMAGGRMAGVAKDAGDEVVLTLGDARKSADGDLVSGMEELLQRFDGGVDMLRKVVGPDVDVLVHEVPAGEGPPPAAGDEIAV